MKNERKSKEFIECWALMEKHCGKWREEEVYPKDEYTYQDVLKEADAYRRYGAKIRIKNKRIINKDYDPNYNNYIYYTAEELFLAFVEEYPDYVGEREFRIANSIEKRCWFADWTDGLAQSKMISRELADSVHWEDSDNPYL